MIYYHIQKSNTRKIKIENIQYKQSNQSFLCSKSAKYCSLFHLSDEQIKERNLHFGQGCISHAKLATNILKGESKWDGQEGREIDSVEIIIYLRIR